MGWLSNALRNIGSGIGSFFTTIFGLLYIVSWDNALVFINLITPKKSAIATGWPEYLPPSKTDSRSPCPGINAMSNHGILPRDGRNITFKQMADGAHKQYNFSPSFSYLVCNYLAGSLKRNYKTDTLDLGDICVHNCIEHDASLTRYDTMVQPDQSKPDEKLINDIISASKDGKKITAADLSRLLHTRLSHSKRTNGQFSLTSFHASFGAGNAATLLLIFGGELADIKPFLLEERIPDGWSTKFRARMGVTTFRFNLTTFRILLGIDPSWKTVSKAG